MLKFATGLRIKHGAAIVGEENIATKSNVANRNA